jgi:hypothetical protein
VTLDKYKSIEKTERKNLAVFLNGTQIESPKNSQNRLLGMLLTFSQKINVMQIRIDAFCPNFSRRKPFSAFSVKIFLDDCFL